MPGTSEVVDRPEMEVTHIPTGEIFTRFGELISRPDMISKMEQNDPEFKKLMEIIKLTRSYQFEVLDWHPTYNRPF
jgi:hypothetical protein